MSGTPSFFTVDGERFDYTLIRKKVKHLRLRVLADGSLVLSAPMTATVAAIERFLATTPPFIRRTREKLKNTAHPAPFCAADGAELLVFGEPHIISVVSGRRPGVKLEEGRLLLAVKNPEDGEERRRILKKWMWAETELRLTALCQKLAPLFAPYPAHCPLPVFRQMTSRWGVCRPTRGQITLNLNLFFAPPALQEYVICHELAHFKHPDHSAAFWAHLGTVLPDCKSRRAALRRIPSPKF